MMLVGGQVDPGAVCRDYREKVPVIVCAAERFGFPKVGVCAVGAPRETVDQGQEVQHDRFSSPVAGSPVQLECLTACCLSFVEVVDLPVRHGQRLGLLHDQVTVVKQLVGLLGS
ncbi:hypothetical protein [Nocardia jiangxiensis]|uniref:hypothetical protein n=1 Tax=Nocardia jiangxiensis TaxID=282685 RepID=UPI001469B308|nr:hypothetical protein [Nocardia jiangxiensis]